MMQGIVDTHVHIWDFNKARYTWLEGDTTILNRTYSIEELEQERLQSGVTEGILVQAANNREDTEWMFETAHLHQWIKGVVGWLPLKDPLATYHYLDQITKQHSYLRGVRHLIHNETDPDWLLQDEVVESLKIVASFNLPYDVVGVIPAHIETAIKLAGKIPQLKMVFDHLNNPPITTGERFGRWGDLMTEAAGHPNFYAKISGLGTIANGLPGSPQERIGPYIEFIVNNYGVSRCFCGGDWPVSLLAGSYSVTWKTYRDILSGLFDEKTQQDILYNNARNFYQLG